MLRDHLRDGALTAAKAWAHTYAEPRHVGFAIVRHFAGSPAADAFRERAEASLAPRGMSLKTPVLTEEATELIESIGSQEDALASLSEIFGPASSGSDAPGTAATAAGVAAASELELSVEEGPSEGESVQDVLAELDRLIGLGAVKEQVQRVIAVVQANRARASAGLATVDPGLHLVFTGAPGTGKTTVARLIARLYAAAGALPGSRFVEVDRSHLVGGYVGKTAMKTSDVVKRAVPGVLFIDEAYSLTPSHESDYGAEAISTLVKAMEDHRHELAVIVAGYGEEMSDFLASNPGLQSRFKTVIHFPDYEADELVQIFAQFVDETGLRIPREALDKAGDLFAKVADRSNFGNARFARSLFERAYARMALRAAEDGQMEMDELMELSVDDIAWKEPDESKDRPIGFDGPGREDNDPR